MWGKNLMNIMLFSFLFWLIRGYRGYKNNREAIHKAIDKNVVVERNIKLRTILRDWRKLSKKKKKIKHREALTTEKKQTKKCSAGLSSYPSDLWLNYVQIRCYNFD